MTWLLEVNVLLALAWANHVHHEAATSWFSEARRDGWATCAVTEIGFVRVSCVPSVVDRKVTVSEAVDTLARLCRRETHSFWSMNRSVTELPSEILTRIQGYRQITDAALLGLARERRGRVATFDAGLANLQPAGRRPSVFLIPA